MSPCCNLGWDEMARMHKLAAMLAINLVNLNPDLLEEYWLNPIWVNDTVRMLSVV